MSKVPFVEFVTDTLDRFSYLRKQEYSFIIDGHLPNKDEFWNNIKRIENSTVENFDETIEKYLFQKNNCARYILDDMYEKYANNFNA